MPGDRFETQAVFEKGLQSLVRTDNVHDTAPTQAQLVTAFGAAASRGPGFVGFVNDANGGANFYIVGCDGANYFFLKMTIGGA